MAFSWVVGTATEPLTGDSALHKMARKHDVASVIDLANSIHVNLTNNRFETPLIAAAQSGAYSCIPTLINLGADIHYQDRLGNTALHYGVMTNGEKVVEALITAKADCNISNHVGKSSLHFVVDSGNIRIANLLAMTHCPFNFDVKNEADEDPFVYALNKGNSHMVRYFLAIGYDPSLLTCDGSSPMHLAMSSRDISILRAITRRSPVDIKNQNGHTPLALAILNGNETAIDILWRRRADHTVVDNDGNSLLHLACKGTSQSIIAQLIKYTVDINARNKESETALHIACAVGHSLTILNLCIAKPDVTIQDDDVRNALMIAVMYGHPDIALMILDWPFLDFPVLFEQRDSENLTLADYCDKFSAVGVKARMEKIRNQSPPPRDITFHSNSLQQQFVPR
jgi:ankyrin repeat protein